MSQVKQIALSLETDSLLAPWEKDPWGILRPPVNEQVLGQSATLAAAAYDLAAEPWVHAGWGDVTVMVDGDVTAVSPDTDAGQKRLTRLRDRLHGMKPLRQMVGTVMNMGESGTCKAMIMAHPPADGKALIAISFMGTGERIFDWISNFRMRAEDGMHQGFLELCRQMEDREKDIAFPALAASLGRDRLTLADVLREMHHPDSSFRLWMCGHSQGAAVMQVYTFRKMREGVQPALMRGYGFASPTMMVGDRVADPSAYPLWHVLNQDDLVPKVGAQVHLGVVLLFRPDGVFRREAYTWRQSAAAAESRRAVHAIVRHMTDTGSAMEISLAYVLALSDLSTGDFIAGVGELWLIKGVFQRLVAAADNRVDAMVNSFARHSARQYESMMGKPMDMAVVAHWRRIIHYQLTRLGVKAFGEALTEILRFPHAIGSLEKENAAYRLIVRRGMAALRPAVWLAGRPPRLHAAPQRADSISELRAVRMPERVQRLRRSSGRWSDRRRR